MPFMLEPRSVDRVNDLGWCLKRLQELMRLKRLQELENQNDYEKVADWMLKIEKFCLKIRYIEDNASQLLWRCNRRKGGFGFVKIFFTFVLFRFRFPNLGVSISKIQEETKKLEQEMEEWCSGKDKWIPLREQVVQNGAMNEVVVGREEDIRSLLKFLEEDTVDYPLHLCKISEKKEKLTNHAYHTGTEFERIMLPAWRLKV